MNAGNEPFALNEIEQESNISAALTGSLTRILMGSNTVQDIVDCSTINMWSLVIRVPEFPLCLGHQLSHKRICVGFPSITITNYWSNYLAVFVAMRTQCSEREHHHDLLDIGQGCVLSNFKPGHVMRIFFILKHGGLINSLLVYRDILALLVKKVWQVQLAGL